MLKSFVVLRSSSALRTAAEAKAYRMMAGKAMQIRSPKVIKATNGMMER